MQRLHFDRSCEDNPFSNSFDISSMARSHDNPVETAAPLFLSASADNTMVNLSAHSRNRSFKKFEDEVFSGNADTLRMIS